MSVSALNYTVQYSAYNEMQNTGDSRSRLRAGDKKRTVDMHAFSFTDNYGIYTDIGTYTCTLKGPK
jgi:hypothetical protein